MSTFTFVKAVFASIEQYMVLHKHTCEGYRKMIAYEMKHYNFTRTTNVETRTGKMFLWRRLTEMVLYPHTSYLYPDLKSMLSLNASTYLCMKLYGG